MAALTPTQIMTDLNATSGLRFQVLTDKLAAALPALTPAQTATAIGLLQALQTYVGPDGFDLAHTAEVHTKLTNLLRDLGIIA